MWLEGDVQSSACAECIGATIVAYRARTRTGHRPVIDGVLVDNSSERLDEFPGLPPAVTGRAVLLRVGGMSIAPARRPPGRQPIAQTNPMVDDPKRCRHVEPPSAFTPGRDDNTRASGPNGQTSPR